MECKLTGFCPSLKLGQESNYWPFAKNKPYMTEKQKLEFLMLKDIYSIGICILELMIGRSDLHIYNISLDSLPLTWSEYPESGPLIAALQECV